MSREIDLMTLWAAQIGRRYGGGEGGKSAYEYAVEGGYAGSEQEFATRLAFLMNGDAIGILDDSGNVVLLTPLAAGTYKLYTQNEGGDLTEYGDMVVTEKAKYTNILTDPPDGVEIKLNQRYSGGSGAYQGCPGMLNVTIPASMVNGKTLYFKGFSNITSSGQGAVWMAIRAGGYDRLNSSDSGNVWTSTLLTDEGNGVYSVAIDSTAFTNIGAATTVTLNMPVDASAAITTDTVTDNGLVMTIGEPIA